MEYKVLLVEDEINLQEIITDYFDEKSGGEISINTIANGSGAIVEAAAWHYDLILLDVMLPGVDGFTICREVRKSSDVPIIFLTARTSEDDRLHGYYLGCDDYVVKPFSVAELYAKVNTWIRRCKGIGRDNEITAGKISIDTYKCLCMADGKPIELAPKEFAILRVLIENKGRTVNRESLLVRLWGYDFEGNDRVVDSHIRKLRHSLGNAGGQIKTVIKSGYRLEEK